MCRSSRILPNRPPQHFTYRGIFFSSAPPNNAVLINGHPALLTLCMPDFVEFVTFSDERNFSPPSVTIDSRSLYIFLVNNQNDSIMRAPVSAITGKCVMLPYHDDRLFLPILHTLVSQEFVVLLLILSICSYISNHRKSVDSFRYVQHSTICKPKATRKASVLHGRRGVRFRRCVIRK